MRCIVSQASGHIWIGVAYIRVVAYIATTDIKVRVYFVKFGHADLQ